MVEDCDNLIGGFLINAHAPRYPEHSFMLQNTSVSAATFLVPLARGAPRSAPFDWSWNDREAYVVEHISRIYRLLRCIGAYDVERT